MPPGEQYNRVNPDQYGELVIRLTSDGGGMLKKEVTTGEINLIRFPSEGFKTIRARMYLR